MSEAASLAGYRCLLAGPAAITGYGKLGSVAVKTPTAAILIASAEGFRAVSDLGRVLKSFETGHRPTQF